ncbi:hypothetical protein LshimejAT787_2200540 [Lyophyllum shimeji]|uniref:Uncharacterized protein n=1 Tax=Lyophyllum shimeji TaxID=47721 RepID=A0A9P3Q2C2_LYOSH|nr:hypothetical protein LshimejAT787_2200540 [Lyophyllum shimeji]
MGQIDRMKPSAQAMVTPDFAASTNDFVKMLMQWWKVADEYRRVRASLSTNFLHDVTDAVFYRMRGLQVQSSRLREVFAVGISSAVHISSVTLSDPAES